MMKEIYIKAGEYYCEKEGALVRTVLGSCVSVCIYDKRLKFGGVNHFFLPEGSTREKESEPYKYAEPSIVGLLKIMKTLGSRKEDLEVKVIGGSEMIGESSNGSVGRKNCKEALFVLKKFGLSPQKEALGGTLGRKIEFNTQNGELKFKYVHKTYGESNNTEPRKIKILIIDDSKPVRLVLKHIFSKDPLFEIVGEAEHPLQAMEIRKKIKPDVITLDLNMPHMDGVTYLKQYMATDPVPTIIITDYNLDSSGPVFDALENGAFDYIKKPSMEEIKIVSSDILERAKGAFKAKLRVKSQFHCVKATQETGWNHLPLEDFLITIGASTGGTEAIKNLLCMLPEKIPPILIVQHIPPVFSKAFAQRLNDLNAFSVKEAEDSDLVEPGRAYVAPGGFQMKALMEHGQIRIKITDDPPVNRFKPSVDYLFKSVANIRHKNLISVILTGMGSDGAKGMLDLKLAGAETIAESEESCVVFGMPKAAIEIKAADHTLPLDKIAGKIINTIKKMSVLKKKIA